MSDNSASANFDERVRGIASAILHNADNPRDAGSILDSVETAIIARLTLEPDADPSEDLETSNALFCAILAVIRPHCTHL